MTDLRIRELERRAAQGDTEAARELARVRRRVDPPEPHRCRLLPVDPPPGLDLRRVRAHVPAELELAISPLTCRSPACPLDPVLTIRVETVGPGQLASAEVAFDLAELSRHRDGPDLVGLRLEQLGEQVAYACGYPDRYERDALDHVAYLERMIREHEGLPVDFAVDRFVSVTGGHLATSHLLERRAQVLAEIARRRQLVTPAVLVRRG